MIPMPDTYRQVRDNIARKLHQAKQPRPAHEPSPDQPVEQQITALKARSAELADQLEQQQQAQQAADTQHPTHPQRPDPADLGVGTVGPKSEQDMPFPHDAPAIKRPSDYQWRRNRWQEYCRQHGIKDETLGKIGGWPQ